MWYWEVLWRYWALSGAEWLKRGIMGENSRLGNKSMGEFAG